MDQASDRQFFSVVSELRAAEHDPREPGASRRLRQAQARALSQHSHSLKGVLWRLMRLRVALAKDPADPLALASVRAAVRDLKAILRR